MKRHKFGPTGEYPRGSLGPGDHGALKIGVAHDSKGNVIINFGTDVSWLGFPPEQAIQLAKLIMRHAGVGKITIEFSGIKASMETEDDGSPEVPDVR
jgi:hypothetical protein